MWSARFSVIFIEVHSLKVKVKTKNFCQKKKKIIIGNNHEEHDIVLEKVQ